MAKKKATKKAKAKAAKEPGVEDVVIALQKAFSRVSRETAKVPEQNARAMVTGKVRFNIALAADYEKERLVQRDDGSLNIMLDGEITTDIDVVEADEKSA